MTAEVDHEVAHELSTEDLITNLRQRSEVTGALCSAAGANQREAMRLARICQVSIEEAVERFPEDWWPRMQREASRILEAYAKDWQARSDEVFRRVIREGGGPTSAFEIGLDGVRAAVNPDLLEELDAWHPSDGGILITGEMECGKTMAALSLAWRLHNEANRDPPEYAVAFGREPATPVVWTQGMRLGMTRTTWNTGDERPSFEDRCESADVLVIDDLLYADHRRDVVLQIAAARLNRGVPTISTTGFNERELTEKLGASGIRRLVRSGSAKGKVFRVTAYQAHATRG